MNKFALKIALLGLSLLPLGVQASNDHGTGETAAATVQWLSWLVTWWPF
ncbi:MAG: hypothetical protein Tsb002_10150 [Wenzhouxiangellaceae bacterium]